MATKCLVLEFDSSYFLDASAAETCKDTRWIFYLLRPFVPSTAQLHVVDALASGEEALNGPTDILRETFDTWVLSVHWAHVRSPERTLQLRVSSKLSSGSITRVLSPCPRDYRHSR
jgi:hypothetical protein